MTPAGNEQSLIDAYSIIPDPHERMSVMVSSNSGPGMPTADRRDEDLVAGCVSRVWIAAAVESGVLRLRWEADSPLVRGLVGLVCRVYEGTVPAEAGSWQTKILSGLKLDRQLSPTRLNGLENAGRRIQLLAAGLAGPAV